MSSTSGTAGQQAAQPGQHVAQRRAVRDRAAPEPVQQRPASQLGGQFRRFSGGQRGQGHRHVSERLGHHTAQAQRDHGAEHRVAGRPGQQVHAGRSHRFHQKPVMPGGFQPVQGLVEFRGVADAQEHPAGIGLVHDRGVEQLDRHRAGQLGQGRVCLAAGGAHPARRRRDAQCAENALGLVLVQRPGGEVRLEAEQGTG